MPKYSPKSPTGARLKPMSGGFHYALGEAVKSALFLAFSLSAVVALSINEEAQANTVPQFEAVSDLFVSEGQPVSVTIRASDSDGDPLSLSMSLRPGGAKFTDLGDGSGSFAWQPDFVGPFSSSASPFVVEFVVSDGLAQSSLRLRVFVQNVNRAPVITTPDSVAVVVGDSINFQSTVFDPDFETVSWRAIVLPSGGMFQSSGLSGASFNWLPNVADSGFSQLTLVATDELGLADTVSTSLLVRLIAAHVLRITTDTVFPGEFLRLSVGLGNREALGAFDIALSFDPSVMAVLSVGNSSSRTSHFESFSFEFANPSPGDLRITGQADVNNGQVSPPLTPGNGEIFVIEFKISSLSGLAGLFLPVKFGMTNPFDSFTVSLSKADGSQVGAAEIELISGGAKIKDQSDISVGDINLNGIPFEISDALRFTNFFIDPVRFAFDAQQFANSDINGDGFTASIADLVALIGVIISGGAARRVSGSSSSAVLFTKRPTSGADISTDVYVNSEAELGGALLIFAIDRNFSDGASGSDKISERIHMSSRLAESGMLLKSHQSSDTLRVLIYSETSGAIADGQQLLFTLDFPEGGATLISAELATAQGVEVATRIGESSQAILPGSFVLNQNYPNPFNPSTKITFTLEKPARVNLSIFDILGRMVNELVDEELRAGEHLAIWNGADESGAQAASGVYVYRLSANGQAASRKMTLLK